MKMDVSRILKKYSGQIKNNKWIAIIFIIGLGLMMLPSGNTEAKKETKTEYSDDFSGYKKEMEEDLEEILSQIKGAGRVSVMITLSDSGNTYFAVDETESFTERDDEKTQTTQTQHVLKSEGSSKDAPLITKRLHPQISGVLICADGAGVPGVKNNITSAVEALLGVKSHRVEVMERK